MDKWWNSVANHLLRSCAGLVPIYSEKPAISLKFNALVADPVEVMCLNFTESKKIYPIDPGFTFIDFSQVGIAQLGVKDEALEAQESVFLYEPTS